VGNKCHSQLILISAADIFNKTTSGFSLDVLRSCKTDPNLMYYVFNEVTA
jgi:hypothetical protein